MRLIDADELTNEVIHGMAIAALHSNVKYFSIVNDIVVAFRETIDNAPTIDAEPKTGEWIDVENEPYCECSVCGAYIDNLDDDYAFCPRCGAKMKG